MSRETTVLIVRVRRSCCITNSTQFDDRRQIIQFNYIMIKLLVLFIYAFTSTSAARVVQTNSGWNLARLSNRGPLQTPYEFTYDDRYQGGDVLVYILSTGIDFGNAQFLDKHVNGANFVLDETFEDQHGEGTAVASVIGGQDVGVAKNVTLVNVKIVDRNRNTTDDHIVDGIEFAIAHEGDRRLKVVVVTQWLRGWSDKVHQVIKKAVVQHGIPVFVPSGDESEDACEFR